MTSLIGKRNSSSSLSAANAALRGKSYESAIALYVRALQATPELAHLCQANLRLARQRLQQQKEGAQRPRVLVCGWNLAQNPAGRVATLAEIYKGFAETEVIGCFFPEKGSQLWAPLKGFALPMHSITVSDEHNFVAQALDLVVQHPCDVLHLSKPRFPNILIGLLYKAIWGSRVIMDIDDEELAFVQASVAIEPKRWMDSNSKSIPPMGNLAGKEWTQISVGLADAFDAVTVANQALQKRYGGIVVPHARDEMFFKPSIKRRLGAREALKLPPEQKVVMFVGTPREHKGLLETAQALASLKRSDVTFLIAGDFPKKLEPLKRQIQSLQGLSTRFLGDQSFKSIPDLWAAGDICVLLQDPQSPAAQFQTPAKLSDVLAMGLTVIAEPTPALAEFEKAGAFESVTQKTLAATLTKCLARPVSSPEPHSFFIKHLTIGAVRPVLRGLLVGPTRPEPHPSLQQLANALSLGFLLPPTTPATVRPAKSSPPSPVKIEKIRLPAPTAMPADYVQRAAEAMAIDDWSGAYECWKALFDRLGDRLSVEQLLRISRELFNLDAFTDAATVLKKAASMAPNSPGVLCEQAAQYYYHCYSSWLMLVTENEPDWYKADGLDVRPDWETACALIEKAEKVAPRNNLRRYVQAYLLLAEEAWDRKDEKSAHEALSIALTAIGPSKLDKNLTADIFRAVNQFRKGEANDGDPYSDWLQKKIKALPINLLSVKDWLCLNDILNWNGLLLCGYVAREKAIDLALAQGKANPNNKEILKIALKAALDRNDTAQADEFLAKLKQMSPDTLDVRELDSCCELMKGNLEAFRQKWPHAPTPAEQRLREYLKGKTVAVVGPAPTGSLDGEEIDGFDVVVRMNWRGPKNMTVAAEFGSRTNVAVYNAHTVRLMSTKGRLALFNTLDLCFIRRKRYDLCSLSWDVERVRMLTEYPGNFYKSLNAVPVVLFNCLLHGIDRINLFKVNFYLGQQHAQGYRRWTDMDLMETPLRLLQPILANHELSAQLRLTHFFSIKGRLITSSDVQTTLQSSTELYLVHLERQINVKAFDLKQRIAFAETAMKKRNWQKAIEAWEIIFHHVDSIPPKLYQRYVKSLRVLSYFDKADAVIQRGLIENPKDIRLYVDFSDIAYDAKDWTSVIFRRQLVLERLGQTKNLSMKHNLVKDCYKKIGISFGNLGEKNKCAHYVKKYLELDKEALWLSSKRKGSKAVSGNLTANKKLKFLCLFDDDSSLYTMAAFGRHLRDKKADVKFMNLVHPDGNRISNRQLQLALPNEEIDFATVNEVTRQICTSRIFMEFDGLGSAKALPFNREFYELENRPIIINLYMGVDFFPATGCVNRLNADVICFVRHSDRNLFREIIPEDVHTQKGLIVYNPKFYGVERKTFGTSRKIENIFFLMQALVPLRRASRLYFITLINRVAKSHPDKNIIIKLRHLESENLAHMHPEEFPYASLAKEVQLEPNVRFSVQPMSEVFEEADFCITCSSTAGIEAAFRGIPTLFWLDYPEALSDPYIENSKELFIGSGLLCDEVEMLSLSVKSPSAAWLDSFAPDPNAIDQIFIFCN